MSSQDDFEKKKLLMSMKAAIDNSCLFLKQIKILIKGFEKKITEISKTLIQIHTELNIE